MMRRLFLSMRFAMLFASVGSLLGALLMFWVGCTRILRAAAEAFTNWALDGNAVIGLLMGATDAFLFGVVLMVFTYAITFGFIIELPKRMASKIPVWMQVGDIAELKRLLVQVILVYLVVDFATDVVVAREHLPWTALVMPLSILAIAAALRLLHREPPSGNQRSDHVPD
jgi:uncharacterized membrane protein YqhA